MSMKTILEALASVPEGERFQPDFTHLHFTDNQFRGLVHQTGEAFFAFVDEAAGHGETTVGEALSLYMSLLATLTIHVTGFVDGEREDITSLENRLEAAQLLVHTAHITLQERPQ